MNFLSFIVGYSYAAHKKTQRRERLSIMMKRKFFMAVLLLLSLSVSTFTGCGQSAELQEKTDQSVVYQSLADSLSVIPDFETTDLDGNPVDESIFENAFITVVNCWGTFCTPCIDEMPELAEWAKEMPDNVQIVGIVCDYNEGWEGEINIQQAKQICEEAGVDFVQIVPDNALQEIQLGILVYPTTFFVDNSGHVVGEIIEEANIEKYKEQVTSYLESQSNEVEDHA